jgi:hypothetical protein
MERELSYRHYHGMNPLGGVGEESCKASPSSNFYIFLRHLYWNVTAGPYI